MNATRKAPESIKLGHVLTEAETEKVNRVLRYHGIAELRRPCKVGEVVENFNGLELGRFSHILGELAVALDDGEER